MNAQTKETQLALSHDQIIDLLKDGNARFVNNKKSDRNLNLQVEQTSGGQFPFATVLSCIDSRIPVETILDQGIGDLFSVRIAGNFVNDDILGSMEFACKLAGSKVLVVMGHTSCGAVKGACDGAELGKLTGMLNKIKPAVNAVENPKEAAARTSANLDFVNDVARKNVELTLEAIRSGSEVLAEMEAKGEIKLIGAMYDVATGKVSF
ncbi:carbonic anhydrase family protein [Lutimonas halocynthiae]|uniref:carbonic anhydrase family protein n=1 Tax=Lutimonas halocynthiae TaxID=1446477 RepID=UPI0025B32F1D|nr:carbonic anhydrase family protein [Lutimonas halocynthiae]MDN3643590.1 carbonic anhydrase family protein [Lutimonas halocynthiae]